MRTASNQNSVEILSAASEATISGLVVVDVEEAVNNTGVFDLPKNTRVKEAIKTAGGLSGEADINWTEQI